MPDEFLRSCDIKDAQQLESLFSRLKAAGYCITSPKTGRYNCIAYAGDKQDKWWWPSEDAYWPSGVPKEETIEAFVHAYSLQGYEPCSDGALEPGFEKIAIYVDSEGTPTHAAKQNHLGQWKSKCGGLHDIEHNTLEAVGGSGRCEYGTAKQFMKRPRLDEA